MSKDSIASVMAFLLMVVFWIACFFLWCLNILKIVQTDANELTVEFVLRIVGVFMAPLGVIMGLI